MDEAANKVADKLVKLIVKLEAVSPDLFISMVEYVQIRAIGGIIGWALITVFALSMAIYGFRKFEEGPYEEGWLFFTIGGS